jgi:hypothetical protein
MKTLLGASVDTIVTKTAVKNISRWTAWNRNPHRLQVWGPDPRPGPGRHVPRPPGPQMRQPVATTAPTRPGERGPEGQAVFDHLAFPRARPGRARPVHRLAGPHRARPRHPPRNHFLLRTRKAQDRPELGGEVLSRIWLGNVSLSVDLMDLLAGGFNGPSPAVSWRGR